MIQVKVEIIHDVVCSWCPIGQSNLKTALQNLNGQVEADIRFLPFELNPDMSMEGETIEAHLERRNNWTPGQFKRYSQDVVSAAKRAGLVYDYAKRTHYYNTSNAHRLIDFAEQFGKHHDVVGALTEQYFTYGMDVSDIESLVDLAASVGLVRQDTQKALRDHENPLRLQNKFERVRKFQVQSIPAFIINGEEFLQGSNSPEFFAQYFMDLAATDKAAFPC